MKDIIKPYQQRLGLQDATFNRIDHQDGLIAIVYEVVQVSGKKCILKICPREKDYCNELFFLKTLTNSCVPRVLHNVSPQESIDGAILMEYIPGELLQKKDYSHQLLFDIGRALASIHLHGATGYGDLTKPSELQTNPCHYFASKFVEVLSECKEHLPKNVHEICSQYFTAHQHLLKRVDGPCFTHRDFRPGNVIVENGKLNGIIDWSAARSGFAEEDFCPIEHGEWQMSPKEKNAFYEGYGSVRPIPDYKVIMPLLRLCRALNVIGFTLKDGSWKSKNKKIYAFNYEIIKVLLDI